MAKSLPRFIFSQGYPKLRINWPRVMANRDCRNADIICWVHIHGPRFFTEDYHLAEHALIGACASSDQKIAFYFGADIGQFHNKTIFWVPGRTYNPYAFSNYSDAAAHIAEQLEAQGNRVVLSARETKLWENKAHMHREFADAGIPHPKTHIIRLTDDLSKLGLTFPALVKEPHSAGSGGIYKVDSEAALKTLLREPGLTRRAEVVIVQELLNIRRDLRVTFFGDEVINWYWRINRAPEWRPTASSFGSVVSFEGFPDQWLDCMRDNFRKLNIRTGAFDVAWQNDDLSTPPYFLEVSPLYSPNPHVDLTDRDYEYGAYKKKIFTKNPFIKVYTDFMFDLYQRLVEGALRDEPRARAS